MHVQFMSSAVCRFIPALVLVALLSTVSYGDIVYQSGPLTSNYFNKVDVAGDASRTWDDLQFDIEYAFFNGEPINSYVSTVVVGNYFTPGCLVTSSGTLASGQVIDDSLSFDTYANLALYFDSSPETWTQQFVGLKLLHDGQTYFGWASFSWGPTSPGPGMVGTWFMQLDGWAYETTPGSPIAVGAVPEPASLSLLALGGLAMLRRRIGRTGA